MLESFMQELALIERHFLVLRRVVEREPIGIVALSDDTAIPRHQVRYSLRILENHDLVEPTDEGAVTTGKTDPFLERHEQQIDAVIEMLETMQIRERLAACQ